jgi:hypothetical protein
MGVGGGLRDAFAVAVGPDARGSIGTLGVGRYTIERWWTGLKQGSWRISPASDRSGDVGSRGQVSILLTIELDRYLLGLIIASR